jgi:hypothetical protein
MRRILNKSKLKLKGRNKEIIDTEKEMERRDSENPGKKGKGDRKGKREDGFHEKK